MGLRVMLPCRVVSPGKMGDNQPLCPMLMGWACRFAGGDAQGVNKPLSNLSEAERTALEQFAISSSAMDPQRLQLAQSALQQVRTRSTVPVAVCCKHCGLDACQELRARRLVVRGLSDSCGDRHAATQRIATPASSVSHLGL